MDIYCTGEMVLRAEGSTFRGRNNNMHTRALYKG